jgi:hypothetical protein
MFICVRSSKVSAKTVEQLVFFTAFSLKCSKPQHITSDTCIFPKKVGVFLSSCYCCSYRWRETLSLNGRQH